MFHIKFYQNDKLIGTEKYTTLGRAKLELEDSDHYHCSDYYEIVDEQSNKIVEEDDIEDAGDIADSDDIIDNMFDDEDSKEGFDWTFED